VTESVIADPAHIRAWQRLDHQTTTSGRIEDGDLASLTALGTAHVINLAMADHPEALADEGAKVMAAGMAYTHIPVPFDAPDETHYQAFRRAMGSHQGAVHVHCIMNWRVSAFFYRLNREQGMDRAAARALLHAQWSGPISWPWVTEAAIL
jgi:protein tyrosine phosphatase (PTP) superfamily phosphohydrolase (DUF442 family)